jgi:hypothetical protein
MCVSGISICVLSGQAMLLLNMQNKAVKNWWGKMPVLLWDNKDWPILKWLFHLGLKRINLLYIRD